ncbi:hypothetical protein [Frankia sp. CiP1_Cm_nod2]|uniref:hypothetical protein n=1 Tax=Frankia sp. CiP1_Cm_nod2 TaxID=2897161 RepID=UPI002023C46D
MPPSAPGHPDTRIPGCRIPGRRVSGIRTAGHDGVAVTPGERCSPSVPHGGSGTWQKEQPVRDLVFAVLIIVIFAVLGLVVRGVERL